MQKRIVPVMCILICVLLLSACSSAVESSVEPTQPVNSPAPTGTELVETVIPPVAQATSRGDKLEASEPGTVKIGGGTPVLVEFFRFT